MQEITLDTGAIVWINGQIKESVCSRCGDNEIVWAKTDFNAKKMPIQLQGNHWISHFAVCRRGGEKSA